MNIADSAVFVNNNNRSSAQGSLCEDNACSSPVFLLKAVRWITSSLPSMPYSAKYIRQDQTPLVDRAITKTEPQRLLGLRGDDGLFACRLADGWSTTPEVKKNGRILLASRTILRLNNIAIFRKTPTDQSLDTSMIGPNHYFGTLDNIDQCLYSLQLNGKGVPFFVKEAGGHEQCLPVNRLPDAYVSTVDALWLSGKKKANRSVIGTEGQGDRRRQALTRDLGIVIFGSDSGVLALPRFDARQFDLSPFGAKLVSNSQPFKVTEASEDPMDVVTYHFGRDYAKTMVKEREGLFLETHDFTQIISPMTQDSGGFITLGRWENGKLKLIGVEVPCGYSLILARGAVHGDSTLIGSYLMAMTVNHKTMATADVVFLRNRDRKNLMLTVGRRVRPAANIYPSTTVSGIQNVGFNDSAIKPLVITPDGPLKKYFDGDIRGQKRPLDQAVRTGSSIVYNPVNPAESYLKDIRT